MDETGQAVKFADSDSSEGSGKSQTTERSRTTRESDDTSYAKAIQNAQRKRSLMNGLSSSAEEDTDKFEMGTYSEAIPVGFESDLDSQAVKLVCHPSRLRSFSLAEWERLNTIDPFCHSAILAFTHSVMDRRIKTTNLGKSMEGMSRELQMDNEGTSMRFGTTDQGSSN
ncbi:uncharacterized protein CEXT_186501 [Caerostris extrusa]|uniref:Uncharacterized protein n=1 Tax=Caerostris extrusa TaxID=172846 RepID=A0AAV4SH51_CAEEX|nr:uncharacterized protein CEXT_186501 [Caerostris extrusa]